MTKESLKQLVSSMPQGRFEMLLAMDQQTRDEICTLINVEPSVSEARIIKKIEEFLED